MATFENAIGTLLDHEGGLADNPADPGGITNFGISINWAQNIFPHQAGYGVSLPFPVPDTPDLIRGLTADMASQIYRICWWDFFDFGKLDDQDLGTKILDASVNMGPPGRRSVVEGQAFHLFQRALNAQGRGIMETGLFLGPDIEAANACDPVALIKEFCRQQAQFYQGLVAANPARSVFLKSWLRRSAWPFGAIP